MFAGCFKFNQRVTVFLAGLYFFQVADTLLFLYTPKNPVDSFGEKCISCIFAQGLPASFQVLLVQFQCNFITWHMVHVVNRNLTSEGKPWRLQSFKFVHTNLSYIYVYRIRKMMANKFDKRHHWKEQKLLLLNPLIPRYLDLNSPNLCQIKQFYRERWENW